MFVITRANVGGAQNHLIWLIEAIRQRFEVQVVTGETGFLTERLHDLNIEHRVVPSLRRELSPVLDLRACRAIRRAVKQFSPHVLHLHSFKAAMLGRIAAIGTNARVIVTAHGWSFSDQNPRSRRILGLLVERALGPLADRIIVVCRRDYESALSKRIADAAKLVLIYNGVPDRGEVSRGRNRTDTKTRLLNIGRLCEQKDQLSLIRMLALLPSSTTMTLVGDGPDHRRVVDAIRKAGVTERVKLDSNNTRPDVHLASADIYISFSRWEGLPLSVIEALSAGLPIVSTDVGGTNELVLDAVNGYLVSAGDHRAFLTAIETLTENPSLRKEMGRESRRLFLEKFRVETCTQLTEELYDTLL